MLEYIKGELNLRNIAINDILKTYGSPLYVYDEKTIADRCQQIKKLAFDKNFNIYFSTKANNSIAILRILLSNGINADAMSMGELDLVQKAGFTANKIIFMSNNVSSNDLEKIAGSGISLCLDSLDELEGLLKIKKNLQLSVRVNNGIASGHSKKVQTGGSVKFGLDLNQLKEAFSISKKYNSKITGLCSHIGSFFLDYKEYHQNVIEMLKLAEEYSHIEYIDFGGGFGVPYDTTQNPFPMDEYSLVLSKCLADWQIENKRQIKFGIQPGRFLVAESGFCITTVRSVKTLYGKKFVGCDLGFNFFPRPMIYEKYHRVLSVREDEQTELADVAGNLCESGDILAKNISLPKNIKPGDTLLFCDAGAYCFSMASNYTAMQKPAEVLINTAGKLSLIRKKESIDILSKDQIYW